MAKSYRINIEFSLKKSDFSELVHRARKTCAYEDNLELMMDDKEVVSEYLKYLIEIYKEEL